MIVAMSFLGIQTESAWLRFTVYHKTKNKQSVVCIWIENIWKDYQSKLTLRMDVLKYMDCIDYNI
jgi:hypothetical protein